MSDLPACLAALGEPGTSWRRNSRSPDAASGPQGLLRYGICRVEPRPLLAALRLALRPSSAAPVLQRRHVLAGELALHHRERDARTAVDGGVLDAKAATCGVAGGKEAGDGTVVLTEHLAVAVYLGMLLLVCSVTFYAYVLVAPAGPAPDARCVSAQSAVWHRIPVV